MAWNQAEDVHLFGTHLKSLFTEKIIDFSLLKPDILKVLAEISTHFKRCQESGVYEEM